MTEEEWQTCIYPSDMFHLVYWRPGMKRSKAGRRKLRLFGVACCRGLERLMPDPRSVAAIDVAERLADGRASKEDVVLAREVAQQAYEAAYRSCLNGPKPHTKSLVMPDDAAAAAAWLLDPKAGNFGGAGLCHFPTNKDAPDYKAYRKRGLWQTRVLRCIFGNPFRPTSLDPAILQWQARTIPKLAQAIYDDRAFDRLPILADALEAAGCDNPDILAHLRGPGPHARGCWPLDLILGKS